MANHPDRAQPPAPVVTFDVFSALIDSRQGGSVFFDQLAGRRGWPPITPALYDDWDRRNKHRDTLDAV